jgi:hypothetical protein
MYDGQQALLASKDGGDESRMLDAITLLGHSQWGQSRVADAMASYSRVMEWEPNPSTIDALILWRLSQWYSQKNDYVTSRSLLLQLSIPRPYSCVWLAAAVASLKLGLVQDAERALMVCYPTSCMVFNSMPHHNKCVEIHQ